MPAVQYNCIVFTNMKNVGNKGFITYHKVSSLQKFVYFIDTKYPQWSFFNCYDNKTKEFLRCIKKGEFI